MKILFADALPEAYVDLLAQRGDECTVSPELCADDIPDAIEGYDVLVVRSTKVTAHAGCQVDHHVGVLLTDPVDHLTVEIHGPRALPRVEVAHVTVDDGRPGRCGVQRRGGDLFRCYRYVLTTAGCVA